MFKPNKILNESLEISSEFENAFANKISSAIPINATVVIIYFNLIFQVYGYSFRSAYSRFYRSNLLVKVLVVFFFLAKH